jgi:hypothetical protein
MNAKNANLKIRHYEGSGKVARRNREAPGRGNARHDGLGAGLTWLATGTYYVCELAAAVSIERK